MKDEEHAAAMEFFMMAMDAAARSSAAAASAASAAASSSSAPAAGVLGVAPVPLGMTCEQVRGAAQGRCRRHEARDWVAWEARAVDGGLGQEGLCAHAATM